jgi:hypothetical protein
LPWYGCFACQALTRKLVQPIDRIGFDWIVAR